LAIGQHFPSGVRHQPRPQWSATLMTTASALPIGVGVMPALATVASPHAKAEPNSNVRIMSFSFFVGDAARHILLGPHSFLVNAAPFAGRA
jgi:hypothetical protein